MSKKDIRKFERALYIFNKKYNNKYNMRGAI